MTDFRKQVYEIVKKIPKGEVMSYKQVAAAIDRPRAYRAVGNALNKNINPRIPCHRIIRSDGFVGGYRKGIKNKAKILKKEGLKIVKLKIQ
jgi:methylated-DNA-[protein]-cysteine S-methyltransferase